MEEGLSQIEFVSVTMMPVAMKLNVTMGLKWAPLAGAPTYAIRGTNTCLRHICVSGESLCENVIHTSHAGHAQHKFLLQLSVHQKFQYCDGTLTHTSLACLVQTIYNVQVQNLISRLSCCTSRQGSRETCHLKHSPLSKQYGMSASAFASNWATTANRCCHKVLRCTQTFRLPGDAGSWRVHLYRRKETCASFDW